MPGQSRALQYKLVRNSATDHVGQQGEVWFDPTTTTLRFYNGDPGGEVLSAGGATAVYLDYGSLPTNQNRTIDLTYKNHWLVDLEDGFHYTLADGTPGQELVFFPAAGLMPQNNDSDVFVDNVKYWNDGDGAWAAGPRILRIFTNANMLNAQSMTTAIFLNGCWHFNGNPQDEGTFP